MSKVAVIGNTARAIGAVCAADLTLSGHEVRYTVFPEQKDQLPEVRKAGDGGKPVVLEGENSPHAKSIYEFAHRVVDRINEIKANTPANVIQIQ